jgi:hypothetical protein
MMDSSHCRVGPGCRQGPPGGGTGHWCGATGLLALLLWPLVGQSLASKGTHWRELSKPRRAARAAAAMSERS